MRMTHYTKWIVAFVFLTLVILAFPAQNSTQKQWSGSKTAPTQKQYVWDNETYTLKIKTIKEKKKKAKKQNRFFVASTETAASLNEFKSLVANHITTKKASATVVYTDSNGISSSDVITNAIRDILGSSNSFNFSVKTFAWKASGINGNITISLLYTYHPALKTTPVNATTKSEFVTAIENALESSAPSLVVRYTGNDIARVDLSTEAMNAYRAYVNRDGNDYRNYSMKSFAYSIQYGMQYGGIVTFTMNYWETQAQTAAVMAKVAAIAEEILVPNMTEEKKVKAANDWIVLNFEYDTTLKEHSAWAGLFQNKTVCQGYALMTYALLKEMGLNVRIVEGYGSTTPSASTAHAWNLVQINGQWYHLDTTWNDPVPDVKGRVSYQNFLLTDTQMAAAPHLWKKEDYPTVATTAFSSADANVIAKVGQYNATSVSFISPPSYLPLNNTTPLSASITLSTVGSYTTTNLLTWSSSNTRVATVDTTGNVKAIGIGYVTIKAQSKIGSTFASRTFLVRPVLMNAISLSPSSLDVKVSEESRLTATLTTSATYKTITWTSSNTSVATVSATGIVKGIRSGSAIITATTADGWKTDTAVVNVTNVQPTSLSIGNDLSLTVGKTSVLKAIFSPLSTTNKGITFTSSDPTVVSVDSKGTIRALAETNNSPVTITATSAADSSVTSSIDVTVGTPTLGISFNVAEVSFAHGSTFALTARPSSPGTVTWKVANPALITLDSLSTYSKTVRATSNTVAGGRTTVTASTTINGKVYSVTIPVTLTVSGTNIAIPSTITIGNGLMATITPGFTPTTTTNKNIIWSSSDSTVVDFTSTGQLRAKKVGTATITAQLQSNDSVTATSTVTVTARPPSSITPSTRTMILDLNENRLVSLTMNPPTSIFTEAATWTSSNLNVATVDNDGKVTAVGEGNAVMTAQVGTVSTTVAVTVIKKVTSVSITYNGNTITDEVVFGTGLTMQLQAAITPTNATLKTVTWKSSNAAVASVSATGLVTTRTFGTTMIIAQTPEGMMTTLRILVLPSPL